MDLDAIAVTFGLVVVAELGDKSQLAALTFASRYGFWRVLAAMSIATALIQAISVGVGTVAGNILPEDVMGVVAGILFLVFAIVTLVSGGDDEGDATTRAPRFIILTIAAVYFAAEFGDKTMLVTATLATTQPWLSTWIGSTAGMITANALAIGVGALIGRRLPVRTIRYVAAALFAVTGVWILFDTLTG